MTRVCTICTHPERREIDQALVSREPYRRIAAHYAVSETAVRRHTKDHLPALLVRAHAAQEAADADELLSRVQAMTQKMEIWIDRAERSYEYSEVRSFAGEWRKQMELLARLAGQLQHHTTLNLHLNPEWLEIKVLIVEALGEHPAARAAVVRALQHREDLRELEATNGTR